MAERKIVWSPGAADDLENICIFISKDSEYYAAHFAKRIIALVETITDFPLSGRKTPEYDDDSIRERIYKNYRIIYRLTGSRVEIVAICNSAKPLMDM